MAGQPGRSGGRRQGAPGRKYPNRTDMRQGPSQPAQAATGQTYGAATQQLQAQKVIPLSNAQGQAAPSSTASTQAAPGMGGGGPQVIPSLTAPTARPNEPITAGLPTGAGPGPEALQTQTDPLVKAAAVLNLLGDKADPHTARLRALVNAHLANQGAA